MDIEVLKKKISTFRGDGGKVRITDDQLKSGLIIYSTNIFCFELSVNKLYFNLTEYLRS